jgi:hypothetical protein
MHPDPERIGPYRVVRRLGEGMSGDIFEGVDDVNGVRVALKLFHSVHAEAGWAREAAVVFGRRHANLLEGFTAGYGSRPWIALRLARRGTLRAGGFGSSSEVRHIALQAARGLYELHQRGITHGDLKPDNILLDEQESPGRWPHVMLADFGAAGRGHSSRGTPAYAAPEVAHGELGVGADLYSLAALLFELVAGHPPFAGDVRAVLHQHATATPDLAPVAARGSWGERLARVLSQALAKDPNQRHASVLAFAFEVDRALHRSIAPQVYSLHGTQAIPTARDVSSGLYVTPRADQVEIRDGEHARLCLPRHGIRHLAISASAAVRVVAHYGSHVVLDGIHAALPVGEAATHPCAIRRFAGDAVVIEGKDCRSVLALPSGEPVFRAPEPLRALFSVFTGAGDVLFAIPVAGRCVYRIKPSLSQPSAERIPLRRPAVRVACDLHSLLLEDTQGHRLVLE